MSVDESTEAAECLECPEAWAGPGAVDAMLAHTLATGHAGSGTGPV